MSHELSPGVPRMSPLSLQGLVPDKGQAPAGNGVRIAEMARRLGVTIRTLRYYEQIGLIEPSRTLGNARIYGPETRRRLEAVFALRALGLSVRDIQELDELGGADADERLLEKLRHQLRALEDKGVLIATAMKGPAQFRIRKTG